MDGLSHVSLPMIMSGLVALIEHSSSAFFDSIFWKLMTNMYKLEFDDLRLVKYVLGGEDVASETPGSCGNTPVAYLGGPLCKGPPLSGLP